MKRSGVIAASFSLLLVVALLLSGLFTPAQAKPPLQSTPTPKVGIEPDNPTPTPTRTVPKPTPGAGVTKPPKAVPPPTLDDLIKQFPDLQPYLDLIKDLGASEIDMTELYSKVIQIYNERGASGVAAFLKDSGLLDKLGIPLAYLDLLVVFDQGGLEAVEKMARERKYINSKDELVGYLALDDATNFDAVKAELENTFGVTVTGFIADTDEIEIGIPLDILAQYQTPGSLLGYLVAVATTEHVVGLRGPAAANTTFGPSRQTIGSVGASTIGADLWHAAGFTGAGIKVGILDMGFAGIKELLGTELPAEVITNTDLDELDAQDNNHGTACAAVVHGMAPDAEIVIAYFDNGSDQSFYDALDFLAAQNVDVVNYSVSRLVGPRDGSSPSAQIAEAFMRQTGALWVNSAGNYATSHSAYEFSEGEAGAHFFGEDTNLMPFLAYSDFGTVIMNWDGNWNGGEKTEYVFTVLDKDLSEVAVAAEARRGKKNQFPFQIATFATVPGDIYYLYVQRTRGDTNNIMDIFVPYGEIAPWAQVPASTVTTPGDAAAVLTVGATGLTEDTLEYYSSQGPTFDNRVKPDVTAPTNEVVAGYTNGFSGTSGAAPAAAGAAALVKQRFPDLSNAEIKGFLMENVVDLGDSGEDNQFGTGRIALPAPEGVDPDKINPGKGSAVDSNPSATITDVSAKFNVKVKGVKGMAVTLSFELDNFSGKQIVAAMVFTDQNGQAVPSADPDYDIGGTIGAGLIFNVKTNQTVFEDVTLFIPNAAFNDVPDDVTKLNYTVGILDPQNPQTPLAIVKAGSVNLTRN